MNSRMLPVMCVVVGLGLTLPLDASQVLVPSGGVGAYSASLESRVTTGMPYSAEITTESNQPLADGNRIVRRTTGRVYRDVDGRVRREDDRASGSPLVSISDPVAGKAWVLDLDNHTARETAGRNVVTLRPSSGGVGGGGVISSAPMGGGGVGRAGGGSAGGGAVGGRGGGGLSNVAGRGARPADNRIVETLPNRSIENLLCSGVRRTTLIPENTIGNVQPIKVVSEEWTSIDLQVLVLTDLNDPRTGRSTYELTRVNRANPDPALFKVPADFTITRAGGRGGR